MTNTVPMKTVWDEEYQITHYKQPVFRALATERLASKLKKGDTIKRSYSSDFAVNEMGANGSYSSQAYTITDESLTVDQKPEVSTTVVEWQKIQDHRPTNQKLARKAMNRLFNYIDGDVLKVAYAGASSALDNSYFGGSASDGITPSISNIAAIFTNAMELLMLNNVVYNPTKAFTGDVKLDRVETMPVAIISPRLWNLVQQVLGLKNTGLGDKTVVNGYQGMFFGFNVFVSNNIAWSGEFAVTSSNLSNSEMITIGGLVLTGVTGSPATAGEFKIEAAAADTATNIKNMLNSPYTSISGKHVAWTQSALTVPQQNMLKLLTATSSTTTVTVKIGGKGSVIVSTTSVTGSWTAARQIQHCIFGVSQSVDLVIQKTPDVITRPTPSAVISDDIVCWTLYGRKVYNDQTTQMVDVLINTSSYAVAPSDTFN